jgi:hypothetical protein
MNRPTLLFTCLLASLISHSQTKMVIDRIQCTSSFTNVFDYLNYPEAKKRVYTAIKDNAATLWNANLYDSELYTAYDLRVRRKAGGTMANRKLNTDITQPTVDGLHLFIGINENPIMISQEQREDSLLFSLLKKGYCIIDFQAVITDNSGIIKLNRTSSFVIQNNNLKSYGFVNRSYSISPSSLVDLTKQATQMLLDTTVEAMEVYAVKCSQAYFTDNFIMPTTVGRKRIFVDAKKDFISFKLSDSTENLLRFPNMNLYLMDLKKSKNKTFAAPELAAINHKRGNKGFKYCNMQRELRNVVGNKSYTSNIAVSMDENSPLPIMGFLSGNINYMVSGNDTVATFSIATEPKVGDRKIQLNAIYNGIDTSFHLTTGGLIKGAVAYDLEMNGQLLGKPFQVLFSIEPALKELYYNNQLVCIAKGRNLPQSFVLIDANLPKDILHQLLMLAFIKL